MMEDRGNRVNEGEGEDVNNLKSPDEENACSGEFVPDVYKRISELTNDNIRMLEQGERSEKHLNRTDRIREAKAITHTNCLARLRLYLDNNSGKWRVGMFEPQHNHELTPCKYEVMFNKVPKAVVTDGDGAMREAIRSVFPDSLHRLCSWHLHQNACENVKNLKFLEDFKKLIYANFTPEKFEQEWVHVIEKHGLSNNKWVRKIKWKGKMGLRAHNQDMFQVSTRDQLQTVEEDESSVESDGDSRDVTVMRFIFKCS
ncbi:MULE transposase domain [Sesbania bispinosa]|nr:MULE transposase domain [Sesbania bispinosa]